MKILICSSIKNDFLLFKLEKQIFCAVKRLKKEWIDIALSICGEELEMNNRILLLCLRDDIETVEDYAKIMNISCDLAYDILRGNVDVQLLGKEFIDKNCLLFNVSREYLLCLI